MTGVDGTRRRVADGRRLFDEGAIAMMGRMSLRSIVRFFCIATVVPACGSDEPTPQDTSGPPADVVEVVDTRPAETQADTRPMGELCPPDALFCISPRESGRCNAAGDAIATRTPCEGATACEPSTGLCRATVCESEAQVCLNLREYQVCNFDGSGYGAVETCPEPLFCAAGRCRACTENEVECLSDTSYRRCAEDASGWSDALDCPNDYRCDMGGEAAGCKKCGLERSCVNAGKARRACTSGEIVWQEDITCKSHETCVDGECIACEADASECLSETTYRLCSSDGKAWSGALTCPEGEACLLDEVQPEGESARGRCLPYACSPRVLLLVDFSGSMSSHWESVRTSVARLVAENPELRFGLKSFPDVSNGSCGVSATLEIPFGEDNAEAFDDWFLDNPPSGATPLAEGIDTMRENAEAIFGNLGGSMIVLTDGEDSCYYDQGLGIQTFLALATSALYVDHQVTTYSIGYSYGGATAVELDTIAINGGSGLRAHIPAGSEEELTEALDGVIDKVKFCRPPGR